MLLHNANHKREDTSLVLHTKLPLEILFKNQPYSETYRADSAISLLASKSITVLDSLSNDQRAKFWSTFTQFIIISGIYKQLDFIQLCQSGKNSMLN